MKITTIPTTNEEVDRQIGGGLPLPSLILVEGEHGTGKSAITAQFMQGLLKGQKKVLYITTESSIKEYLEKMKMITFDFRRNFIQNQLSILPVNVDGVRWSELLARHLLPVLGRYISVNSKRIDVVVIDSLSVLTMHADANTTMDFFTKCKTLVAQGMTIIMTLHPNAITDEISLRIRSTCDGYLRIKSSSLAGKSVKVMEIVKLIGSSSPVTSQFSFDVDQVFGIKIVPLSMANA